MKAIVIDNSPINREQIRSFFEKELHYQIAAFGSKSNEVLPLIQKHEPELIILDMDMPPKNGLGILEEILLFNPEARVIVTTDDSNEHTVSKAFSLGALSFIKKPFRFNGSKIEEVFRLDSEAVEF